jgi:2-polyprenyl-6-methoxyphenol hydroxylase-like FAD-dependent oxidoreductase
VHNKLFRLAQDAGVEIRLGCRVTSVNPYRPSVTLDSGEIVQGDMVVGADGDQSYVRDVVLDYHEPGVPRDTAVYM